MRLRLLLRRLTVSAPRMAVRSALPWPLRWALWAVVAGFCSAMGLWAFEFGKDIAGLDSGSKAQLQRLRAENADLAAQLERTKLALTAAQSVANTADTVLTTEKVTQQKLLDANRLLESENLRLKSDLGFFEQLIPASGVAGLSLRGLQVQRLTSGELKWQVLVIQANKNPVEFKGRLEITFNGVDNGKPWTSDMPGGPMPVTLTQYGRMEGVFRLPPNVVVKSITAKVMEGAAIRATHTLKL
ncbi:DUF6776 family protein [Rhodoferax sp.]|uniref:DUF6776 family protein n=1 Tax=Rhodoferax sp. TaxID=50421 RepID=UPI002615B066|nr:DUF6776 family protein [Rhodoferax sp.]MDD2809403.1 hypothetical protein [Rhodoferax sp.]MDD4943527.1 hypothetical protein [Rhodoferax sp.]